jgi:hypothetical protein
MSELLSRSPYEARDDAAFLREMNALTRHHQQGCEPYRRIIGSFTAARSVAELPYLHAAVFKHIELRTAGDGIVHEARTLHSSATTGQSSSRIALDQKSSALQSRSSQAILRDFVGESARPLLVLDHPAALRERGRISARIAAALTLKPLASEIHFLLERPDDPSSVRWDLFAELLGRHSALLVYGFTWMLWQALREPPANVAAARRQKTIHFVHSGGWKKLEAVKVDRAIFDGALLRGLDGRSRVIDYYGLVEQVGVIYPLCEAGVRHAPLWADVLVRDPYSGNALRAGETGALQLLNVLALGAPYHSVLTEDLGRLTGSAEPCRCGRRGTTFELLGRMPRAELRGCANV